MQTPIPRHTSTQHDEVTSSALMHWEQARRPAGCDLEFWLRAEQRVIAAHDAQAATSGASRSRLQVSSSLAMHFATEPIGAVPSRSTGTNRAHESNGGGPAKEPATRLRQSKPSNRILVVDDDTSIREFSAVMLTSSGYQVDTAEDGNVGWEALHARSYDLLITDNDMPKVSGVELVKKLRFARIALPVVLASGNIPTEALNWNSSLQLAATLAKPFTLGELLGTVKKVLRAAAGAPGRASSIPPDDQCRFKIPQR
jgi:two-component system chemotaxis response regulator CheY